MPTLLQDLRFSFRLLRRSPGFTVAAIAILALGIGANTAIFSLVHELLWSPRSYPQAEQVVQLYTEDTKHPGNFRLASYPVYRELAAHAPGFEGLLAYNLARVGVGEGEASRRTLVSIVSANYFTVLGVPLARGRKFLPEEDKPGSNVPVVIASHQYWRTRGFDPNLVGSTVRINERLFTIVGIAPENFTGTMAVFGSEFFFPLGVHDTLANGFVDQGGRSLERANTYSLFLLGRLKPEVTAEAASSTLRTLARNLEAAYPAEQKDQTMFARVPPRLGANTNPSNESQLTVLGTLLLAMSGMVLLIACLNLANMLLARGTARRKEIAVRIALGGARGRIVAQLLTEGLVLALAGGAAGFVLAVWASGLLMKSLTALVPFTLSFHGALNPAVLGATLAFCTLATLAFALGPALKLSRRDTLTDLKQQTGDDATGRRRFRWLPRHPLVVAQLALSLALLSAAGLFVRSALNAARFDTGFRADATILAHVDAGLAGYDQTRTLRTFQAINERLAALPGVEASAVGALVPLGTVEISRGVRRAGIALAADARPASAAEGRSFDARWSSVGGAYFQAAGLALLRGRAFTPAECDLEGAPPVAIIDENLARQLYPEGDALGQRIEFAPAPGAAASEKVAMEIVGIVPATRWDLFDASNPGAIFQPFAQGFQNDAYFHVKVAAGTAAAQQERCEQIRREIRAAAPGVPVFGVMTFAQHLDASIELWLVRAGATIFGVFGGLALLLAVVGIYGVNAYAVSRRTREIGIRMALGAEPGAVRRMILREGAAMTATGVAFGLLVGVAVGQACGSMLYRVAAFDPLVFTVAPLVLALAALLACWMPARRATRVNPMVALRSE